MPTSVSSQTFEFSGLSEHSPLIKKIKDGLGHATGQSIPYVTVHKAKRLSGAATKSVDFGLENNQVVTFVVRQLGDVMRVAINGKDFPMAGDLSPDYLPTFKAALTEIGDAVRLGQKGFDKRQSQEKVKIGTTTDGDGRQSPQNTTQQIKRILDDETLIDQQLVEKTGARDLLLQQLDAV